MSVTTVSIQITCPDWRARPADEHVADLWEMGGNCIHYSDEKVVPDIEGYQEPLTEPRLYDPIDVSISSQVRPDGLESASPIVHLEGREMSVSQALALADALRDLVELYRSTGCSRSSTASGPTG